MKYINTKNAPRAIWPYSQWILINGLIYSSGQIWLNPDTMQLESWIERQTERVLMNLEAILWESWSSKDKVIKTTIFLSDINNFKVVNEIYSKFFESHTPARSTVEVSKLPLWALIEIELIALTESNKSI